MTAEPVERLGRADLHIHTLASDGTSSTVDILAHVAEQGVLDVIAIADHDRIDAALAARVLAADRGHPYEVVVAEEVSTRGGHLLALWIERPIPAMKPLRWSIEAIHDQGGLAVPAHPITPFLMCAQGSALRDLLKDDNPAVHPDGLETFNPTELGKYRHDAVVRFAREHDLARLGNSDAHVKTAVGRGWTTFPGRSAAELRAAILARTTQHHGHFHGPVDELGIYGRQLAKYARGWQATVTGKVRRDGTGRDLGYPGGRQRPERFDRELAQRLHAEKEGAR